MKRILLFLTVFLSTLAFAGERVYINPEQNQDLKIQANVGGTPKDAITVTGSTGNVSIGNTAHTGTNELGGAHKIVGVLIPGVNESGDASGGISIWANAYGGASFPYRSQTAPGGVSLRIIPRTGNNNSAFVLQTNQAGDSTTASQITTLEGTQAGTWNIGPTGFIGPQTLNGSVRISASAGPSFYYAAVGSGTTTCSAACATEDTTYSLDSDSGACMQAWRSDTGVAIACGDATSVGKKCLCAGVN